MMTETASEISILTNLELGAVLRAMHKATKKRIIVDEFPFHRRTYSDPSWMVDGVPLSLHFKTKVIDHSAE